MWSGGGQAIEGLPGQAAKTWVCRFLSEAVVEGPGLPCRPDSHVELAQPEHSLPMGSVGFEEGFEETDLLIAITALSRAVRQVEEGRYRMRQGPSHRFRRLPLPSPPIQEPAEALMGGRRATGGDRGPVGLLRIFQQGTHRRRIRHDLGCFLQGEAEVVAGERVIRREAMRFSWDSHFARLLEVYEEVAKTKRGAPVAGDERATPTEDPMPANTAAAPRDP